MSPVDPEKTKQSSDSKRKEAQMPEFNADGSLRETREPVFEPVVAEHEAIGAFGSIPIAQIAAEPRQFRS